VLVKNTRGKNKRAIDYRIRTPQAPNRQVAGNICSKFKAARHSDCLVILHNPQVLASVAQPNTFQVAKSAAPRKSSPNTPRTPGTKKLSYRVQLASYRTERGAAKGQIILKKLLGGRNEKLEILVRKARKEDAQVFNYQIRIVTEQIITPRMIRCTKLCITRSPYLSMRHNRRVIFNERLKLLFCGKRE